MRALLQRVAGASVSIEGEIAASIGRGLVILLGVSRQDTEEDARYLVDKTLNLRVFPDGTSYFDRSALDIQAELLVVSQFTLYPIKVSSDPEPGNGPIWPNHAYLGIDTTQSRC